MSEITVVERDKHEKFGTLGCDPTWLAKSTNHFTFLVLNYPI